MEKRKPSAQEVPFPIWRLPASWSISTIGDCCLSVNDGDWIEKKDQGGGDYRLLQISNVGVGSFRETGNFRYITKETFDRLSCREVVPGNILVARMPDPTGRAWHVQPMPFRAITAVDVAILEPDPDILDGRFAAYYLNSPFNLRHARARAGGTTRERITKRDLATFPLPLPPLPIQRRIAGILSAYDELIENSQRRMRILESMARALYREWFVHFRFPGHESVPRAPSPLGSIPQGWEVHRLDKVCCSIQDGDWIETKDQGGEGYRLLQISNIGVGEFIETGNFRYITQETFDRLRCNEIVPDDLLVARMPTPIGRGWLATKMPWRMITAVDVAIIRAEQTVLHPLYLVRAWNENSNLQRIAAQASGTTRLRITRRELAAMEFVIPPLAIQQKFAEITQPNSAMIEAMQRQIRNLRRTRDLLLPRLMSGQIEVEAA